MKASALALLMVHNRPLCTMDSLRVDPWLLPLRDLTTFQILFGSSVSAASSRNSTHLRSYSLLIRAWTLLQASTHSLRLSPSVLLIEFLYFTASLKSLVIHALPLVEDFTFPMNELAASVMETNRLAILASSEARPMLSFCTSTAISTWLEKPSKSALLQFHLKILEVVVLSVVIGISRVIKIGR